MFVLKVGWRTAANEVYTRREQNKHCTNDSVKITPPWTVQNNQNECPASFRPWLVWMFIIANTVQKYISDSNNLQYKYSRRQLFILWCCGSWHRAILYADTNILEKHTASIFRLEVTLVLTMKTECSMKRRYQQNYTVVQPRKPQCEIISLTLANK